MQQSKPISKYDRNLSSIAYNIWQESISEDIDLNQYSLDLERIKTSTINFIKQLLPINTFEEMIEYYYNNRTSILIELEELINIVLEKLTKFKFPYEYSLYLKDGK